MSRIVINLDWETYSETDLKAVGAYAYATCPTTDILVMSARVQGEKHLRRWRPGQPYPFADIHPRDIEIRAWNSQFERLIWNHVAVRRYGWPVLDLEQFVCTSAQARMMAAGPAKLEKAAPFYGLKIRKDMKGHALMLKMCKPATEAQQTKFFSTHDAVLRGLMDFGGERAGVRAIEALREAAKCCHHTPDNLNRLHDYCDEDVWTEIDVGRILPLWHKDDLEDFWLNERINDRGLVVDVDFAQAAVGYAEDEKAYFASEVIDITGGAVKTPRQFVKIKEWLLPLLSDAAQDVAKFYEDGKEKYSFDADTRANLLAEASADADWIAHDPADADDIVEFLELLDAAGKSAVSKYQAILDRAVEGYSDGYNERVHGCYMFAGASQSTRFSSVGIQMHNLVRDVPDNGVRLIKAFTRGDERDIRQGCQELADTINAKRKGVRPVAPEPIHALARLVRPTITGCRRGDFDLVWCDWSSIEACVLPWLTLDLDADARLEMLRRGEDIYLKSASDITGRKITKADEFERQAFGKVPELSLGYLGGKGAFKAMAKNYGVRLPDAQIEEIVKKWREANPWAQRFGARCEQAAMAAIERPGVGYSAGRLEYIFDKGALGGLGALFCVLPSGKEICYPDARIEMVKTSWGKWQPGITARKSSWHPKKGEDEWPRVSLWQGLLVENASQAIATGDILRLGLRRCERAELVVCGHTHDEIMIESADPQRDGPRLLALMTKRPPWPGADALPLRAEWGAGFRYKVK